MLKIILFIIVNVLIIYVNKLNTKLDQFKQIDLTKENFAENISLKNVNDKTIDSVTLNNLSILASNIISNNGNELTLNFSGIDIPPFRGMVCPFYITYEDKDQRQQLLDNFWFPCDGQNSRPDLNSGRFVLGNTNKGAKGGQKEVKLTINEIPSHNHRMDPPGSGGIGPIIWGGGGKWNKDGGGWHSTGRDTNSVGDNLAHDNMPPYVQISYWIYLPPV